MRVVAIVMTYLKPPFQSLIDKDGNHVIVQCSSRYGGHVIDETAYLELLNIEDFKLINKWFNESQKLFFVFVQNGMLTVFDGYINRIIADVQSIEIKLDFIVQRGQMHLLRDSSDISR